MSILHLSADAPAWARAGADALLVLHIGGGSLGILSGAAALISRKGERLHRMAGTVFFGAKLVAYAIGAGVAPFLADGQRTNTVAGILALYLLMTGWLTVKRPPGTAGLVEATGLVTGLLIAGTGLLFVYMASQSPGTAHDSPPQAFYAFVIAGLFGAAGDLNALLRHGL